MKIGESPPLEGGQLSASPKGTPREATKQSFDALAKTLALPDVKERLAAIGFEIAPVGPDEFGPYVVTQIHAWKKMIQAAGITPE